MRRDIRTDGPTEAGSLSSTGAAGVGIAGILVAGAGYVVLLLAARTLSLADNAQFLTYWSLLFALVGITGGIQNECTRAVRAGLHRRPAADEPATGPRVVPVGLLMGAVMAVAVLASAPVWAERIVAQHPVAAAVLVAVGVVLFAGHASLTGALAGLGRWDVYARVVSAESVVRLVLVVAVVAVSASLLGLMVTSALAMGTWVLAVLLSPRARSALGRRADRGARAYVSGVSHAMLAALATAALVVGYPVLLRLTTDDSVYEAAAPLLMAISLTRAPLLLPLNAFQGVAITHFVDHPERRGRTLLVVAGILGAVGAVGAGLAAVLGPWLLEVMLGSDYRVGSALLAGLTVAGALLALLTLTGTAVLALGRHRAYSAGWTVASVVAILLLLVPAGIETRVLVSLCVAPVIGAVVHGLVLVRPCTPAR